MKGRERERNICVWLPLTRPPTGDLATTQACALTGNQTGDLSVPQAGAQDDIFTFTHILHRNHTSMTVGLPHLEVVMKICIRGYGDNPTDTRQTCR